MVNRSTRRARVWTTCRFGSAGVPISSCWTAWLDELGIKHTGIVDETEPIAYSTVVFRDPDNIQLELIFTD